MQTHQPHTYKTQLLACADSLCPSHTHVGSYGPKGEGMLRTYSNATPGKDKVLSGGEVVLYRLKVSPNSNHPNQH